MALLPTSDQNILGKSYAYTVERTLFGINFVGPNHIAPSQTSKNAGARACPSRRVIMEG
jgi:hypothetical protein